MHTEEQISLIKNELAQLQLEMSNLKKPCQFFSNTLDFSTIDLVHCSLFFKLSSQEIFLIIPSCSVHVVSESFPYIDYCNNRHVYQLSIQGFSVDFHPQYYDILASHLAHFQNKFGK